MIVRKASICDTICRKLGVTRKRPSGELSKRELLLISEGIETLQINLHELQKVHARCP